MPQPKQKATRAKVALIQKMLADGSYSDTSIGTALGVTRQAIGAMISYYRLKRNQPGKGLKRTLFTFKEVSALTSVQPQTLRNWVQKGRIKSSRWPKNCALGLHLVTLAELNRIKRISELTLSCKWCSAIFKPLNSLQVCCARPKSCSAKYRRQQRAYSHLRPYTLKNCPLWAREHLKQIQNGHFASDNLITVRQAAFLLHQVTVCTVYRWQHLGLLTGVPTLGTKTNQGKPIIRLPYAQVLAFSQIYQPRR